MANTLSGFQQNYTIGFRKTNESKDFLKYYFAVAFVASVSYFLFSPLVTAIIIVTLLAIYLVLDFKKAIPLCSVLFYFIYLLSDITFAVLLVFIIVAMSFNLFVQKIKIGKADIFILLLSLFSAVCSYVFGFETQVLSAALTLSNILFFIALKNTFGEEEIIWFLDAIWSSSLIFIYVSLFSIIRDGFSSTGRLGFQENVRDLANNVSIPCFLWFYYLVSKTKVSSVSKIYINLIGFFSTLLLFLTLSKGNIFAIGISLLVFALQTKQTRIKIVAIIGVVILICLVLQTTNLFDFSRFFDRNHDLNGRTTIWNFYHKKLYSMLGRKGLVFGFGPGNLTRIAPDEYLGKYYVHSAILDFYFSYGIFGFGLFLFFSIAMFRKCFLQKNKIGLSFLLCLYLSYFVSGASTNPQLFVMVFVATNLSSTNYMKYRKGY